MVVLMNDADLLCLKCVTLHIPKTLIFLCRHTWTPLFRQWYNRLQQPGSSDIQKRARISDNQKVIQYSLLWNIVEFLCSIIIASKRAEIVAHIHSQYACKISIRKTNIPTCLPLGHHLQISTSFHHLLFPLSLIWVGSRARETPSPTRFYFSLNIFIGLSTHSVKRPWRGV